MTKVDEYLNHIQRMYGFNYVKSSVIVDDVCYLNVTINIPLIDYNKTLKVFSYLTEDYQEINDEKMFHKVIELFPKDNINFDMQIGVLERIMQIRHTIYKKIKDADMSEKFDYEDDYMSKINHLIKHSKLADGSLKEIKNSFDKVK